jgi:hypothetical protein
MNFLDDRRRQEARDKSAATSSQTRSARPGRARPRAPLLMHMSARSVGFVVVGLLEFARPPVAGAAPAFDEPILAPRFTLPEFQYPQLVAGSVGLWVAPLRMERVRAGAVGDLEVGLSGVSVTLGPGATSNLAVSYEKVWSVSLEAVVHQTWPWWSPWLATATTYVGAQLSGQFFAFRCAAGPLWPLASTRTKPILSFGCGIGLP